MKSTLESLAMIVLVRPAYDLVPLSRKEHLASLDLS